MMKTASSFNRIAIIAAMAVSVGSVSAQDRDIGKIEYQSNCASCHGIGAKGDGPMSTELKRRPTDLTVLAKRNNGVFPLNSVYRIIDGRDAIPSHGTREMPVWGYRFVPPQHFDLKLTDDYIYMAPTSPEPVVHARILAVIDYLNRIQEK
jgi:mono/diheme cytochrome c family protein